MPARDLDAYSPFKALRYLDNARLIRSGLPAPPVHMQVILSDLCNQRCTGCAYRDPNYTSSQLFYSISDTPSKGLVRDFTHPERNYNPDRQIPYNKVVEILDDCRDMDVSAIQLTGGGEPTLHPRFLDVCQDVLARKMKLAVVSNGVYLGKFRGWARMLGEFAAWVRVSIDAGTERTYCETRGVPPEHFAYVQRAVETLRSARDSAGSPCVIGAGFVVTPWNWREVVEGVRLAKRLGADNIRISAMFSSEDEKPFAPFHDECAALCREAEAEATDTFQVYNRYSNKLAELQQKSPDFPLCGYQYFTGYIGADLNVYRCCVLAYNPRGVVGSISDQRLIDLWMSAERVQGMRSFRANTCARCQFLTQNRMLDYVLRDDDPAHCEFV